ncbi:prepilin-type N-terminal cleavage/methylation domain-containing protein [Peptoniphilus sp. GNH]|nr:prepilin-type cleavage/methylation protein [Clostridiales bacterium KA00134]UHR02849.1 prepilin-type N-terminal cleavage/methylation domain-containing protein [Peptoniphilus sp. GNH]
MKKKAFTLLEMVVVIAIILILMSIAIPRYARSSLTAQVAAHNANVKVIKNAAVLYLSENPEKTSISMDDIKPYIEGKFPKPMKNSGASDFSISVGTDGSVNVTPGEMQIVNGKAEPKVD